MPTIRNVKKKPLQTFVQPALEKRTKKEAKAAQLTTSEYLARILDALAAVTPAGGSMLEIARTAR